MLAEVLQSEGSHEMEFDGVYQIMVSTLYHSANWKCPKCGKIALCFLVLCCSLMLLYFNSNQPYMHVRFHDQFVVWYQNSYMW